jgi:hypothetical protein
VSVALPLAWVVSVAATVTVKLPRLVGVPLPARSRDYSIRRRLIGVPSAPFWLPGLVTVPVLPGLGVGVGEVVQTSVIAGCAQALRLVCSLE